MERWFAGLIIIVKCLKKFVEMSLKNQNTKPTVLITGASGTIGRSLVEHFYNDGWNVVAGYFKNNLFEHKSGIDSVKLDVRNYENVKDVFSKIAKKYGGLDVLINAAGIVSDKLLASMTVEDWDAVFDVNLKGVMNCSREAVKLMANANGGHIMNFSSVSALQGRIGQSNYSASKSALIGFSLSLAKEAGKYNVRVNIILPGVILSRMTENLDDKKLNDLICENALGRTTTPDEVARFCLFLASTKNISGQIFQLDSRIRRFA